MTVCSFSVMLFNLCEMKFAVGKYQMTRTYADYLRDRVELFRSKTNTRHVIVPTMVTTYGIADGINKGVVQQEILMDDLFD